MTTLSLVLGVLVLLALIDRLLLWAEMRGWIFYRRSPRIRRGMGTALLNIDAFYQPSRQHVIELRQDAEIHREQDDAGGDGDDRDRDRPHPDRRAHPRG